MSTLEKFKNSLGGNRSSKECSQDEGRLRYKPSTTQIKSSRSGSLDSTRFFMAHLQTVNVKAESEEKATKEREERERWELITIREEQERKRIEVLKTRFAPMIKFLNQHECWINPLEQLKFLDSERINQELAASQPQLNVVTRRMTGYKGRVPFTITDVRFVEPEVFSQLKELLALDKETLGKMGLVQKKHGEAYASGSKMDVEYEASEKFPEIEKQ